MLPGNQGPLVSLVKESKNRLSRKLGRSILFELGRHLQQGRLAVDFGSFWGKKGKWKIAMPLKWGPRKQAGSATEVTQQLRWEGKG